MHLTILHSGMCQKYLSFPELILVFDDCYKILMSKTRSVK